MSQWARNNPAEAALVARQEFDEWPEMIERDMQECCRCHKNTSFEIGSDDALYREDGTGPYCDDCFEQEPLVEAMQNVINQQPKDDHERTKP